MDRNLRRNDFEGVGDPGDIFFLVQRPDSGKGSGFAEGVFGKSCAGEGFSLPALCAQDRAVRGGSRLLNLPQAAQFGIFMMWSS